MTAFVHLVIGCESLRTESRLGGGFTILIGEPGSAQKVSFSSVEAAEAFGQLCGLAAITHGPLGDAVVRTDNVAAFPLRSIAHSDNPQPPKSAA